MIARPRERRDSLMVSSTRRAIAGIFVILVVAISAYSQTTPPKEAGATISGRVTIKDKGVAGITVALRFNDRMGYRQLATDYRAVTDADGVYRITNVMPGRYSIIPAAPAFFSSEPNNPRTLLVNKSETIENVDFNLVRGGVITGKVVDDEGRPLIEEEVLIIPFETENRSYYIPTVVTDDRGVYRAFGLAPGKYRVAAGREESGAFANRGRGAYKRAYYPGVADPAQATPIEVSEGSESANIDLALTRPMSGYAVSGRVVDGATGQPVANITYEITLYISEASASSWGPGRVTGARGEFSFENLVPGKYGISFRPRPDTDWRAESIRFEIVDQDVTDLVVKARKGASVSGVMVLEGADEKAVREQIGMISVAVSVPENETRTVGYMARVEPDGSFRVANLPSGLVTIYLPSGPRFRLVRVEYGGVSNPRLELKEGQSLSGVRLFAALANASIRGQIELENGKLPANGRFFINLRKIDEDPKIMSAFDSSPEVDARGRFAIEALLPGTYELNTGVYVPGTPGQVFKKVQQVVVTGNTPTNVTVTIDLNSPATRP